MIGIELFSGVGGMSLGASLAGIKIKLAVEIDLDASKTYHLNHLKTKLNHQDVRKLKKSDLIKKTGNQSILFGGPPCQGFSRSNLKTRNINNPNNWLFLEFIRVANLWKPDWVVLENVQGLKNTESGLFLDQIIEGLTKIGYEVSYQVLNAINYGVPQNRERLFIVGNRNKLSFTFPTGCYQKGKFINVQKAISDLPILSNGSKEYELPYETERCSQYARTLRKDNISSKNHYVSLNTQLVLERYKYIPQGGNWSNIPRELMFTYQNASRCHTGIYHRLHNAKPAVVIGNYRKNMLIHPTQNRGLSVREAARLQSFPDHFEFLGNLGSQQQQVGNAVPPFLAKAVFEKIMKL